MQITAFGKAFLFPLGKFLSGFLTTKTFLAMKLTTILLLAACLQLSASGYGQRITITGKNMSLKSVFSEIRKQSGYNFFYYDKDLVNAKEVSIEARNAELEQVLVHIFKGQPLTYTIAEKTIVVREKMIIEEPAPLPPPIDVHGRVINELGDPVVVTVTVKGTKTAVSSNDRGEFEIKNIDENAILVITGVSILNHEVRVNGRTDLSTIRVKIKVSALSDTVVIGYGTASRKDLTGAVASVNVNEVRNIPFTTFDQALTGKAAGVQVIQTDGSPGGMPKIRIRGGTSLLGGNDPLYIIDGIPVTVQNRFQQAAAEIVSPTQGTGGVAVSGAFARGLNSLAGLNINDIESIDILKDASSTAIYGSRAANGVVIITTRKGKYNQKPTFEANYYTSISTPIKEKILNADQYRSIMKESAVNLNNARAALGLPSHAEADLIINDPNYLGTANTDWLDLVLRTGITHNADISVRGGGNGSRYFSSLGYTKNEGTVLGTDFQRISGKLSLDNDITRKFSVNTNIDYGFTSHNITNGVYAQAFFMPPTLPAYNPDGSVRPIQAGDLGAQNYEGFQTPLELLRGVNKSNAFNVLGSMVFEYDLMHDLKFRSINSVGYVNYRQENFAPSTIRISSPFGTDVSPGVATQASTQDINLNFENTLTWNKKFSPDHQLNSVIGTSWQKFRNRTFSASGQGFPDDEYLNNLSSAALALPPTGTSGQNVLLSYYLRANYAFKEKYYLNFTGRADISSKFPEGKRNALFPSGGVAWTISEEKFMKDVQWLSNLKLRASAGYAGTQNLGDNLFYTLYSPASYGGTNALLPTQLGNDELQWERTFQKDAGLDLGLFNSRVNISLGYYVKRTDGILFNTAVATSSGFSSLISNIADIQNKGYEFDLRADFVRNRNFQWSGALNVSRNQSKVLAISNDMNVQNTGLMRFGDAALMVGQPLGLLYGRMYKGVMRTQKEVDDYINSNILAQYGFYPYLGIGDPHYVMDPAMNYFKDSIIGNAEPKFFGGFTNSINYKNFSLVALITFSYGGDIMYLADVQNFDMTSRKNKGVRVLDHYSVNNPDSENPRLLYGESSYSYASSHSVFDASYARLKSVTVSYQFPETMLSRLKVRNASLYASAMNLFTITNYPGADPEVNSDPYSIIGGYTDVGGYPTIRQFNIGFRLGF